MRQWQTRESDWRFGIMSTFIMNSKKYTDKITLLLNGRLVWRRVNCQLFMMYVHIYTFANQYFFYYLNLNRWTKTLQNTRYLSEFYPSRLPSFLEEFPEILPPFHYIFFYFFSFEKFPFTLNCRVRLVLNTNQTRREMTLVRLPLTYSKDLCSNKGVFTPHV